MNGFLNPVLVGACESLESLRSMRLSFTAQDGLDSFSHYSPSVVKVALKSLFVEDKLAESLECALYSDDRMTERHTDVAEHGGVGKVTLKSADRELLAEELENSVSDAEVAFRVFVVDRVYLVWHCA